MKKILIAFLALFMLVNSSFIVRAEEELGEEAETAENEEEALEEGLLYGGELSDGLAYKLYDDYSLLIEGNGECSTILSTVIPEYQKVNMVLIGDGVTVLGPSMFEGFSSLADVEIGSGVKSIGSMAFANCTSLDTLYIPSSVEAIEEYAFIECLDSLTFYTDNSENKWEGKWDACNKEGTRLDVIYHCPKADYIYWTTLDKKTEKIAIPEGITIVPDYAFYKNKAIKEVVFPSTMDRIGDYAFFECGNLKEINLPETLSYLGTWSFYSCSGAKGTVVIPEGLKEISQKAFTNDANIERVILSSSVESISFYAFEDCHGLKEVVVPPDSRLNKISDKAFRECSLMKYFYIPASVERIVATSDVYAPFSADFKTILLVEGEGPKKGWDVLWNYETGGVIYNVSYEQYLDLASENRFSIHFDNNEGFGEMANMEMLYPGINYKLPENGFERPGYSFAGWSLSKTGLATHHPGSRFSQSKRPEGGVTTFYAIWKPNKYQISYVMNGGTGNKNPRTFITGSDIILKDPKPKKGMSFTGWYLEEELNTRIYSISELTSNIKLYAGFETATNKISFNIDDPKECLVPEDLIYEYVPRGNVILPNVYSEDGTRIIWCIKDTRGNLRKAPIIRLSSLKDYELYGTWAPENYSITYVLNGCRNNAANKKAYTPATGFELVAPTPPRGAVFLYWLDQDGNIVESTVDMHGDLILSAVVQYDEFNVRLDLDGGYFKNPIDERWIVEDEAYEAIVSQPIGAPALAKPIKDGYVFKGWFDTIGGRSVSTIARPYKDMNLVARWAIGKYTVSYNLGGGRLPTGTRLSAKTYTTADEVYLTDVIPSKNGYRFAGWTLNNKGTGDVYLEGSISNLYNQLNTAKIIFYAKWEPVSYTVTFKAEGLDDIVKSYKGGEKIFLDSDMFAQNDRLVSEFAYTSESGKLVKVRANTSITNLCKTEGQNIDIYVSRDAYGKEKWTTRKYSIVYDLHPNQLEYPGPLSPASYIYNPLSCVVKISNPIKEGYSFIGWAYFDGKGVIRFIRPVNNDGSPKGYCYMPKGIAQNVLLYRLFKYELD